MKPKVLGFITIFSFLPQCLLALPAEFNHSLFDRFLHECVHAGKVDYKAAQKNRVLLNNYLLKVAHFSQADFETLNREEKISFLINVYNAGTIKIVVDHYPVKEVRKILTEEDSSLMIMGRAATLRFIKEEMLIRKFRDERIHAALFQAAKSGPLLRNEAYRADHLDGFLDADAKRFVNDSVRNPIESGAQKIYLSPLFKWHAEDFILNYGNAAARDSGQFNRLENAVLSFLIFYMTDPKKKSYLEKGRYKIRYLPYDWALDEVSADAKK